MGKKLAESFGSVDLWEKKFRATGAMRGIGWTVLYQDSADGRLINFWINEHDAGHPAGCMPILCEQAFWIDPLLASNCDPLTFLSYCIFYGITFQVGQA
jgi:Fe-Mn family superoxide dismutase